MTAANRKKKPKDERKKKPEDEPKDQHPKSKVNMVCQDEDSDSDYYYLMVETINSVYQIESPKKIFATMVLKETSVNSNLTSQNLSEPWSSRHANPRMLNVT